MDVFEALSDPTRRQMLDLLTGRERAVTELVESIPRMSQPAISRHLRVLREAGLVHVEVDRQRRVYSVRAEGLAPVEQWLEKFRRFWATRLDGLEKHLDHKASRSAKKRTPQRTADQRKRTK
jgi:DNA-binding transcriptional ArsR family regulator